MASASCRRGRFNICNPSEESMVVDVSGLREVLAGVSDHFARDRFSLSICERDEYGVESEDGFDLFCAALRAQSTFLYNRDAKPAKALLDAIEEDDRIADRIEREFLLSEVAGLNRQIDDLAAKKARAEGRLLRIEDNLAVTA